MSATSGPGVTPSADPLRRERTVILALLLLVAAAAWGTLVWQSRGSMPSDLTMGMGIVVFLLVWLVMMVAMMFPAAAPMVLLFARFQAERRRTGRAFVPTWVFVGAYMLVWLIAGVAGYVGALVGERIGGGNMWFSMNGARVAGGLLILAGLYQLSPVKRACLSKCRSPFAFITSSWRDGYGGAVRMGLQHGLYCFGCCWLLFVLLFPLGMMNVAILALLSLVIFIEKVAPYGDRASWVLGPTLMVYGLAVIVSPDLLPTMHMQQPSMHM